MPWPSASFDAVECNATVAYLARPDGVFAEVGRLLSPGGVAVVAWSDALSFLKLPLQGGRAPTRRGALRSCRPTCRSRRGWTWCTTVAAGAPREAAVMHQLLEALGREVAAEEPFSAVLACKPGGGGGEGGGGGAEEGR